MCASECAFGPVRALRVESRGSYQVPWNRSYRSDTYVWVLGPKPGSWKAAKAPDHRTIFPAHRQYFITRQKPKTAAMPAWHSSCPFGSVHHLHSAPCFPWCHPGAPGHPPHSPLLPPLHLPLLPPRYPWVQQSPPVCHMDNQADCPQQSDQWSWKKSQWGVYLVTDIMLKPAGCVYLPRWIRALRLSLALFLRRE